ncbi:DUF4932 domain-containing protein [Dyadobacter jiangsuensis]
MKTSAHLVAKCSLSTLLCLYAHIHAQAQHVRVVHTGSTSMDVRDGNGFRKGGWGIDPSVRPDVYETYIEGESKKVSFITDRDSITFDVMPGKTYPFAFVLNGKDSAFTEIRGIKLMPRAQFSKAYQQANRGKTLVEIPQMYELLNVVFALTDKGRTSNGLIPRNTDYYSQVMEWFTPYRDQPAVKKINTELAVDGVYHALKMDAYAFELNADGIIVQSPVYDRIGLSNSNSLRTYIADLQQFAKSSRFQEFYKAHQPFYNQLITAYRDSIGVPEMQRWLGRNFPSTRYDAFKIILSPLVGNNQSASFFEFNGFREAQAHVNFPFHTPENTAGWSPEAIYVKDGNIVFTELNHAFIGPEGEKPAYRARIQKAFSDLAIWNDPSKPARSYNTPQASFEEYMNWALVNLRYVDYAPPAEQDKLIAGIEDMMVNNRGFRRFKEFDQFLIKTYKARKKGQTVADLYPVIIGWFEENS